jgi:hypothetical protein
VSDSYEGTGRTGLYRLLADTGRLLYVGISGNPDSRWGTHSTTKSWWAEVVDRKIEWFPTREEAAGAEIVAIKEERPLYNKQHAVINAPVALIPRPLSPFRRKPGAEEFEREMPQNIDAEQATLGGMMLSGQRLAEASEILVAEDFYAWVHEIVFTAILDLYARGQPADPITTAAELTKRGEIVRVGGAPYLHTLVNVVPSADNVRYYAKIVHGVAVKRRLIEAGQRIVELGYEMGDEAKALDLAYAEVRGATRAVPACTVRRLTTAELHEEAADNEDQAAPARPNEEQ